MNFGIFSRWMAEDAGYMAKHLTEPYIWISTSSEKKPTTPVENQFCRGVLRINFDDIERPIGDCVLFNKQHAKTVVDFVNQHKDNVSLICVHCDAGISRSAAVAMALGLWLNKKDPVNHLKFFPNMHVKIVLMAAISEAGGDVPPVKQYTTEEIDSILDAAEVKRKTLTDKNEYYELMAFMTEVSSCMAKLKLCVGDNHSFDCVSHVLWARTGALEKWLAKHV